MVRPHSVIPVGHDETRPDYDLAENVTFHVFELEDGPEATAAVSDLEGREDVRIAVRRAGQVITARKSGSKKAWRLLLRTMRGSASVEGGLLAAEARGAVITPHKDTDTVVIRLQ